MKQDFKVEITKQGLNDRYNEKAAQYLKAVLGQICINTGNNPIDEGWLGMFNRIKIKDSTKFVLPEGFAKEMPGFGGVSSKSAACIQYEFDLKSGTITDLNITSANRPDSTDARDTQDDVSPNDLIIRDLGYYSTEVLAKFIEKGAFIISKLNVNTVAYEIKDNSYRPIEFDKQYMWMQENKIQRVEKQVYIGSHAKLPVRLIIEVVPDEVFAKRMQKVNKYNKRKGFDTSDNYTNRARFNLIITNIPCEKAPMEVIVALYHVRWQIELVFKVWKSIYGIHKIGKMKFYRWLCILYAKLILITIYWQTIMPTRSYFYKTSGKLLSIDKCFKTLKDKANDLRKAIRKGGQAIKYLVCGMQELISEKHWIEKKKNKLNFEQIIYLYYCKSNIYVYI